MDLSGLLIRGGRGGKGEGKEGKGRGGNVELLLSNLSSVGCCPVSVVFSGILATTSEHQ